MSETVTSRGTFFPSIGIFGGSGGVGVGIGVTMGPGGGGFLRCERTLFFQNGKVVEQTWQGPDEVLLELPSRVTARRSLIEPHLIGTGERGYAHRDLPIRSS